MNHRVLIHNISTSEILCEAKLLISDDLYELFCQPNYNKFIEIFKLILSSHRDQDKIKGIKIKTKNDNQQKYIGFDISNLSICNFLDKNSFINVFTYKDIYTLNKIESIKITSVIFPLISVIIPKWLSLFPQSNKNNNSKNGYLKYNKNIIILNGTKSVNINDKEKINITALNLMLDVLECFIESFYPDISIIKIKYREDMKYKDTTEILDSELKPILSKLRRNITDIKYDKWKDHFSTTFSLCDNQDYRVTSIGTSLRSFLPNIIHLYPINSFVLNLIKHKELDINKVKYYPNKEVINPPIKIVSKLDSRIQKLVLEIKSYRDEIIKVIKDDKHEMLTFWLRKSKMPVISVLLIEKGNSSYFIKGINIEVSLPTGAICAERNAISNALTMNPSIHRYDMKMIALLMIPVADNLRVKNRNSVVNPLNPCRMCKEWLLKIAESNPDFRILTFDSDKCDRVFISEII